MCFLRQNKYPLASAMQLPLPLINIPEGGKMKLINNEWVKLIDIQNPYGGRKEGFPSEYIGMEGKARFFESENKYPGKVCAFFETVLGEKDMELFFFDSSFRTSFGDMAETEDKIVLTTHNSIYTFLKVTDSKKRDEYIMAIGKKLVEEHIEAWILLYNHMVIFILYLFYKNGHSRLYCCVRCCFSGYLYSS